MSVPTTESSGTADRALQTNRLDEIAVQLAREQATARPDRSAAPLLDRLKDHERLLQTAYSRFTRASTEELVFSYAAEWLLDNFYIVRQTLQEIRQDMPRSYYNELPKLDTPTLAGYPRVYALAREIIRETQALLEVGQLRRFIHTYQTITPLTMGELWALPIMLSFSLLEHLATAIAQVTQLELSAASAALAPALREGSEDTIVANCIVSLRFMATEDWKNFFEDVSLVERTLRTDPAQVYGRMDFETRDRYRKVIEQLAMQMDREENEVARTAIDVARGAAGPPLDRSERERHVGYYLIDAGRPVLESRLAYRPPLRIRWQRWIFRHVTATYLGSIAAFTSLLLFLIARQVAAADGTPGQLIVAGLLALTPASSAALTLINAIVTHQVPPHVLPRLEFEDGVPPDCSTMLVMPALIASREDINYLLRQIEMHFLRNAVPNLYFALLTDFADAPAKNMPEDNQLIAQAVEGVRALNARYGTDTTQPFYLFHRQRLWNPGEQTWMGWERKRGKLHEFNCLLRGNAATSFITQVGDLSQLASIQYVITVDADTIIPRGSARRLIGTLAHPLNRPVLDPVTGEVLAGYTVLQPRTDINPPSANQSLFTRIFSGDVGLDLYTLAVSDVYQDLFQEGIYVGKGIYAVDAFERSLQQRVPENSLLSHDLFEGINGRVGLVTNVVLLEDYPPHYLVHTHRLHRWIRGDWQLLPWVLNLRRLLGHSSARLSMIDRWKIIDNLRRSLLAPTTFAFLLAGWLYLPGPAHIWTITVLALLSTAFLVSLITALLGVRHRGALGALRPLRYDLARWLLALAFMPYEALLALDAIGVTLIRVFITRKHLLKWTTAAHSIRLFGSEISPAVTWRHMMSALIVVIVLALVIGTARPAALTAALPVLALWLMAPSLAYWIGRPLKTRPESLSKRQRQQLRVLARRTWLFFERFVGPDDNWLPPDHFQETPRGLPAHRTSPTNIGLWLLATLGAYDLGYIGVLSMALRLRDTFDTLLKMERYRGHWLNWYDTRNLQPLPPAYVSTVDSGNLAACLLVLKQAVVDLPRAPVLRWQRRDGLRDTLALVNEAVEGIGVDGSGVAELREQAADLHAFFESLSQQVAATSDDPARWPLLVEQLAGAGREEINRRVLAFVEPNVDLLSAETLRSLRLSVDRLHHHLEAVQREIELLTPWLLPLHRAPELLANPKAPEAIRTAWRNLEAALSSDARLDEIGAMCAAGQVRLNELRASLTASDAPAPLVAEAEAWCEMLDRKLRDARLAIEPLLIGYRDLIERADQFVQGMDFRFLFNPHRKVFHIGYNVTADRLDNNFYDLLASEARIASLIAIAKRDVPQTHWLHLARPLTLVDGVRTLLSWSGTMFEYLMPSLFMRSYEGTLLHQSVRAAVDCQIAYGRERGVPWGISESAYYHFDAALNYQYRAFGVPALGFKRGLGEDAVIAPYASLMALAVRPKAVMENLQRLRQLHMLDQFGLYEALDYTPNRLPPDQKHAIVRAYMAHHQGMIMLALTNYLGDELMVERFHREPHIQSVELLLQEQIPLLAPVEFPQNDEAPAMRPPKPKVTVTGWPAPIDAPLPQVNVLSNGRYSVLITSAGGGYSHWQENDLTRWHTDTTLDDWGTWLYLRDLDRGACSSVTVQPSGNGGESREAHFYPHMAEFRTWWHDIGATLEITIAPDDDVEIRRVTLVNHTDQLRRINVTSYSEVALAPPVTYQRHPQFNKLFIESEYLPHLNALVFHRRLRAADEKPVWLGHALLAGRDSGSATRYETDRLKFIGRGGSARSPAVLETAAGLSGTVGATLDPCMALTHTVELKPHASAQLIFLTVAGRSHDMVLNLIQRYRSQFIVTHTFDQARTQSELMLRHLTVTSNELQRYQQLLSALLYSTPRLRPEPALLVANTRGQPGLWAYGISGDHPIVLVQVTGEEEAPMVLELLQAHTYWRARQIKIDLVIFNLRELGYAQEVENRVQRLIAQTKSERWVNQRGGIFVLNTQRVSEADRVLLYTTARVVLRGGDALADQLRGLFDQPLRLPEFMPVLSAEVDSEPTPALARPTDLQYDNGFGGFTPDGREYVIYLAPGQRTPLPWSNVIANPDFGFLVSEAGGGYSWALNSGENRLTPWRNDPVGDQPGEALYIRDEETGRVWSPTPLPAGEQAPFLIRHGAGYTIFQHHSHGLKQQLDLFVAPDEPVKFIRLRLENTWQHTRRITATYYAEWVLGVFRETMQPFIIPEFDDEYHAVLARNPYNVEFGERVAFLAANQPLHGLTTDRTEFLGRMGSYRAPAALKRIGLGGQMVPGLDPCAAIMLHIDLPPGESREICFLLGQGADRSEALRTITRYQDPIEIERAWQAARQRWDEILGTVTVQTPDPAIDLLLNRWLLYQSLTCRMWGRSALYQSSGAYGFRDQLQDVMAYVHAQPQVARAHILESARHQFEAGDVLHWWHPPSGRGLRSRCSDDLVWLPYVTAYYVTATDDTSILAERLPFLRGQALDAEEHERYGQYESTSETYTLYEHCRRALKKGLTSGPHGLPLMGTGDWNDGMNRVGVHGQGESIWLGWFLYDTLLKFAPLCERQQDERQAELYRQQAHTLQQALESHGWDGAWYRRAFYDDGSLLGSAQNRECQIDSIAQSWAVLSRAARLDRAQQAMESVARRLVREDERLIMLFTPPLDKTKRDPGYIKGYLPGIRENGGQYTHAALWAVWAFADLGQGNRAGRLFRLLNPICHADSTPEIHTYQVEPYVVAADVYSVAPHVGHGGWTWYTGSASWMYRLGLEAMLGLKREGQHLRVKPCIPNDWPGFAITYRYATSVYHIEVKNLSQTEHGVKSVRLDGATLPDGLIPLRADGRTHEVLVEM